MQDRIKVMLTTEGTYPFHQGGVSTWCNILVKSLSQVDYVVYSIVMNPFVTQKFSLPQNSRLISVPLWGTEEPSEHILIPFSQVYLAKRKTQDSVVRQEFVPLFTDVINEIITLEKNSPRLGSLLSEMYKYFQEYDYKKSFKAEQTWDVYKNMVLNYSADSKNKIQEPTVFELIQSLGWIYRFFNVLNTPLPQVNVTHSAAAAFCGLPCVLSRINNKTPFLLTEHGVYLREQYLSLSKRGYPSFLNTFLMRLMHSITQLNYAYADQVSPVCHYNTRWEREFGVKPQAIKVIYNGVDKSIFTPATQIQRNKYPTVVSVARIDPVKDQMTLIRAAALVKERIKDVRFVLYGSVTVPEYYDECRSLVERLELEETFIFAGHTDDIPTSYQSGDVIALSSISEAFPYSVIEAMMTGKAIVTTDVGGIREALGETGFLVKPRDPRQLAHYITELLENPELRVTLGDEARQRALNNFTLDKVLDLYYQSYAQLGRATEKLVSIATARLKKQQMLYEKGYILQGLGYWKEAIQQFRMAINEAPESLAVPIILTEIANTYNQQGQYDRVFNELEKAEFVTLFLKSS